jgi:hypothetical protein
MCAPLTLRAGLRRKEETLLDPLPSAYLSAREARLGTHWANLATRLTALIIERRKHTREMYMVSGPLFVKMY